jgi:type II secretory pathway pseudopilin PulG
MNRKVQSPRAGFTITELIVASGISALILAGVVGSMAMVFRGWREAAVNSELNINLELALERIRQDMRLSSVGVGLMSFYPADAQRYTAISFPMAEDRDGDGLLDRNAENRIVWTRTVIYHVVHSTPNELRRTTFYPRATNSTPEALYAQLKQVAESSTTAGFAAGAMAGETVSSRIVFRNLTELYFSPPDAVFDGYSPTRQRASTVNFGSIVLDGGDHELAFKVIGKNPKSSGYKVQIDRFRVSLSGSSREGEIYVPANTHPRSPFYSFGAFGGSVTAEDMAGYGGAWSGNAQLVFNAWGPGSRINFNAFDDLWCDANFDDPGGVIANNCSVKWDTSFRSETPFIGDKVVSMDKGIAWSASVCGDTVVTIPVTNAIVVANTIYGGTNNPEMTIAMSGCSTRLLFERPDGNRLHITNARITDPLSGNSVAVTFNTGHTEVVVPVSGPSVIASDWIPLWEVDRDRNYVVSFTSAPQDANPWGLVGWQHSGGTTLSTINGSPAPTLVGLHALETGYPKQAIYRSGIYDTMCDNPNYKFLTWTHVEKFSDGGDIDIRVRAGDQPDLAGASWTAAYSLYDGYFQSNGANSLTHLPRGRYVQYEALLQCGIGGETEAHLDDPTAILRDVTITWAPALGLVDLEVDFGMGPDCGLVQVTLDGQKFVKSMLVELAIFKDGPRGVLTVRGHTEIRPLNTGK